MRKPKPSKNVNPVTPAPESRRRDAPIQLTKGQLLAMGKELNRVLENKPTAAGLLTQIVLRCKADGAIPSFADCAQAADISDSSRKRAVRYWKSIGLVYTKRGGSGGLIMPRFLELCDLAAAQSEALGQIGLSIGSNWPTAPTYYNPNKKTNPISEEEFRVAQALNLWWEFFPKKAWSTKDRALQACYSVVKTYGLKAEDITAITEAMESGPITIRDAHEWWLDGYWQQHLSAERLSELGLNPAASSVGRKGEKPTITITVTSNLDEIA